MTRTDPPKSAIEHMIDRVLDWLGILLVIALGAAWAVNEDRSTVLSFGPADEVTINDAAPGDWVDMRMPVLKRRNCEIVTEGKDKGGPRIYWGDGQSVAVRWARNGPFLETAPYWQEGAIKFQVPRNVPPGPAVVVMEARFKCILFTVDHHSPPIDFKVLEPAP
ncbi:MAG: hypothetical protein AAFY10_01075 [Pseudomonadota bacterium]